MSLAHDPMDEMPDGPPCPRCGSFHTRCSAHNRAEKPCRRSPEPGLSVCRFHGGLSPRARAAGLRRVQEAEARQTVAQLLTSHGVEYDKEHPLDGLLEEIWRSAAAAKVYGQLVSTLDFPVDGADHWEELRTDDDGNVIARARADLFIGPDHKGDGAPHVLVKLWNEERDRHAKYCKMALEAGIAERMVRMAEEQGSRIVQVILQVVGDPELGMEPEKQDTARKVAARYLRALPGGAA